MEAPERIWLEKKREQGREGTSTATMRGGEPRGDAGPGRSKCPAWVPVRRHMYSCPTRGPIAQGRAQGYTAHPGGARARPRTHWHSRWATQRRGRATSTTAVYPPATPGIPTFRATLYDPLPGRARRQLEARLGPAPGPSAKEMQRGPRATPWKIFPGLCVVAAGTAGRRAGGKSFRGRGARAARRGDWGAGPGRAGGRAGGAVARGR